MYKSRILIKLRLPGKAFARPKSWRRSYPLQPDAAVSFAQARACASGRFLISPFLGVFTTGIRRKPINRSGRRNPGVKSVRNVYDYYKQHHYETSDGHALPSHQANPRPHRLRSSDHLPDLLKELQERARRWSAS
ncbi:transaldolase family protein [Shigella flexneri]